MKYLLDTNICIYVINKKAPALLRRLQSHRPDQFALSTITLAELAYGVVRSKRPEQNRTALLSFVFPFKIIDFDQAAALEYGWIRGYLESQGRVIGPMDLLLAAQARSRGLTVVTNNEKEFNRIPALSVENWT